MTRLQECYTVYGTRLILWNHTRFIKPTLEVSTPSSSVATEPRWRGLVERIRRGTCILLLGPGVAIDPDDPEQTPLSVSLAHRLAADETVADDKDLIDCNNLTYVAQLFHRRKKDRIELEMVVDGFYQPFDRLKPDFHQDIAALPFTLCINTTPDNFLYNALFEAGKEPRRDHYNFRRARKVIAVEPTIDKPLVYDLYGSRTEPESLVLTENDRLEFLVNVIKGSPELSPFVRSQFANSDTSFLSVTLSTCEGMARLRDLHNISLYESSGFASLIDAIQTDWQRRQGQAVKMA